MNINKHEVYRIVRHNPSLIKYLYDNNGNKGYVTRLLNKLVPFKVGIEFELFGSIVNYKYNPKYDPKYRSTVKEYEAEIKYYFDKIVKEFNIVSYSEDLIKYSATNESNGDLNEIRVCINKYKQLTGLYNICNLLKLSCKIPQERGGIHIHIDFTNLLNNKLEYQKFACNWFSRPDIQSRVLEIFGGYKGNYNKPGCGLRSKGKYINVSRLDTIEFRIGKLTFDYSKIMFYIIELSKLVNQCKHELQININNGNIVKSNKLVKTFDIDVNDINLELTTPSSSSISSSDFVINGNSLARYGYIDTVSNYYISNQNLNSITTV